MKHVTLIAIIMVLLPFSLFADQIEIPETPVLENKVFWHNKPKDISYPLEVVTEFRINPCGEIYDVKIVNGHGPEKKFAKYIIKNKLKLSPVLKNGSGIDAKLRLLVIIK